jgi:hypothetical protein
MLSPPKALVSKYESWGRWPNAIPDELRSRVWMTQRLHIDELLIEVVERLAVGEIDEKHHPMADRKYAFAIDRNRSCPGVAQIGSLIGSPSMSRVVARNSPPIVDWLSVAKTSSTRRFRIAVLPTPLVPMIMTLNLCQLNLLVGIKSMRRQPMHKKGECSRDGLESQYRLCLKFSQKECHKKHFGEMF